MTSCRRHHCTARSDLHNGDYIYPGMSLWTEHQKQNCLSVKFVRPPSSLFSILAFILRCMPEPVKSAKHDQTLCAFLH